MTGVVYTNLEHAVYQEFGTSAHTVKAKGKKMLHWVDDEGKDHFAKEVHIPAMKPQPFMLPSINRNRLGIRSAMMAFVKRELIKLNAK